MCRMLAISEYEVQFIYRVSKLNEAADCVSRMSTLIGNNYCHIKPSRRSHCTWAKITCSRLLLVCVFLLVCYYFSYVIDVVASCVMIMTTSTSIPYVWTMPWSPDMRHWASSLAEGVKFRSLCDGGKPAEKSTSESISFQPDKLVRWGIALMPGQYVSLQNYFRSYLNYYATCRQRRT